MTNNNRWLQHPLGWRWIPLLCGLGALLLVGWGCQHEPDGLPQGPQRPPDEPLSTLKVTWPPFESIDSKALQLLSAVDQDAVRRSSVPVLVPDDQAILSSGVIGIGPYGYFFNSDTQGINLLIDGSRVSHAIPGLKVPSPEYRVHGRDAFATRRDTGWQIGWLENGEVIYKVNVFCNDEADVRCESPSFALGLAEHTVYVGGAGK